MNHLSEAELFSISQNERLSEERQMHFDSCLFCQAEFKKIEEFDQYLNHQITTNVQHVDVRQNVFDALDIDFRVEDKKDNFMWISIASYIIACGTLYYFFPIDFDISRMYRWFPIESIKSIYSEYKFIVLGSVTFSSLYIIELIKTSYRAKKTELKMN